MEDIERKITKISKKCHPKEKANCLSSLFFCWSMPLFVKGWKKELEDEDLYGPLKAHKCTKLGDRLKKAWKLEANKNDPSLRKLIIRLYYSEMLLFLFLLTIQELVIKLGHPLLVGKLMDYYDPNTTSVTTQQAYIYASGIVALTFLNSMILHQCFFGLQHLSMKIQIACRSLIYEKSLKLSKTAVAEGSVGQIVNLISNDVSRFHYLCLHLHQLFIAPIQTIVVLYLLFATVDTSAMVGVSLLFAFIPALMYMGRLSSRYRLRTALKTDQRIGLMNEIISGIKVIKMYTWEKPFAKLVQLFRRLEIKEITATSYVRSIYLSTTMFLIPVAIFLCILTYVLTGNKLQAHFVFVTTSFYGTLRQPLTIHLPTCIRMLAEINISLKRIQKFLMNEEIHPEDIALPNNKIGIVLENVDVQWTPSSECALSNINLTINPKQLVAIVGRVGCGKTTIINTILQEIPVVAGKLQVGGTLSYASQEPWLFSSSIRQNILFGQPVDEFKYERVVRACALEKDFSSFPFGDRTIVGEKGVMLSGGQKARVNLARAMYKEADVYLLDDPLSAVDVKVGKQIFDECIAGYLKDKCTVLVTHQIQYLHNVDRIFLLEDGKVVADGTYNDLKNLGSHFSTVLSENENDDSEKAQAASLPPKELNPEKTDLPLEVKEQRGVGKISRKVYLRYLCTTGSCLFPSFVIFTFILTQLSASSVDYFLTFWVNLEQKRSEMIIANSTDAESDPFSFLSSNHLLYIYAGLIAFLTAMVLVRSLCFVKFSMDAAQFLHDNMFNKIVRATMRFFNTNSTGRVLNRFARDMGVVDENLPSSVTDCLQVFLNVIAITIIVSTINYWVVLPTVIIFGLFYFYKVVFLSTSRNLKRIESIARSPMFSHLTQSLQGLSTIRAFDAGHVLQKEFDSIQDHHSSAYYMYMVCSRAFGLILDINCVVYVGIVIFSFLFIGTETYGGNVGLAITQSIALTGMLQRGIRQWSELENQMTSVERIVEYSELTPEHDEGTEVPPTDWPQQGQIEFVNLYMKYSEDGAYVLKNVSFTLLSKEKIGVVGRTGAGKSSLIAALFRLADTEGVITIDGVNTKTVPLERLRSGMSIIPQEPVLFSGLLRKNLDPFDEYSDDELWKALEEVELKKMISELAGGLSAKMSESGSNFSVGERQLLCLARAIVRKNKILILDEATANVDLQTDELIQKTIKRKFVDCTVITIAHRLHTIMDSDKILVLDEGRVMEFGRPNELLKNTNGAFYQMVTQTGKVTSEILLKMTK